MNLLLDTHSLIWFINGDEQLPVKSRDLIKNLNNNCFISIASIWEVAIKISLRKLDLNGGFEEISKIILKYQFELLPVTIDHVAEILGLQFFHRDPFDRLLIAQSIVEKIPIITKDSIFEKYRIELIWN